jgi:transmembrane sensor
MDFLNNTAKDFVLNESFQKWILEPDDETCDFWNDWTTKHPHKMDVIEEAKTIIQNIRRVIEKNVACDSDEVWERISKDIDGMKDKKTPTNKSFEI